MRISFLSGLLIGVFALTAAAHADTIINASSTGWCEAPGCNTASLNSGLNNNDAQQTYNDFFTFTIPTGETITSATLNIWASDSYGTDGSAGSGTYTLDQATGLSFSGLGSGTVLGSIDGASVSAGSTGMFDSITINAAGLADLNSA